MSVRTLWRDVGFGFRLLLRKPGFTVAAVLSLVLGIGLNTAVFTLLDAVLLRPLPVEDLDSLAAAYTTVRQDSGEYAGLYGHSHGNYLDLQERSRSFEQLALYQWHPMNFSGGSEPERATGMFVSANYFETLGIRPARGRFFLPEEDRTPGTHPVAVLSHACWSRLFGADPGVLGQTVGVNGQELTVVGVGPRGFKGTDVTVHPDFWLPIMMYPVTSPYREYFEVRGFSLFNAFGRLRDGVTREQAEAELMKLSQDLEAAFPKVNERLGARVRPLLEGTFSPGQRELHLGYGKALAGAVGLILLIACLNVSHLLLLRGMERRREIAVRQSLGAGRGRVAVQLATENLTLFLLGGFLSLPVGRWAVDLLWRFRPPRFADDALELGFDWVVFGVALALAAVCGLTFGLLPALRASRPDLVASLKEQESPPAYGPWPRWLRPRRLLTVGQVALTLLALILAGLFLRSLQNAYRIDVGFDADKLLAVTVAPGEQGYNEEQTRAFYRRMLERVRAIPGVRSAAVAENRLLRGAVQQYPIQVEGRDGPLIGGGRQTHRTNAVFPGYFATAGIPLTGGRDFDDSIRPDGPPVAIINRTMAEIAWPGEDPIGKRFRIGSLDRPLVEVIGVARDAKYRHVHEDPQCFVYVAAAQRLPASATLHVRAEGEPAALLATVRGEVHALDPDLPLADVRTLARFVEEDLWKERVAATLLSVFGALALLLATLGIYGILAQTVSRQRREIGIRLAVGARRSDLLRWVLGEGAALIAAGLVLGLVLAFVGFRLTTAMTAHLVEVGATDPLTYAVAALVLFAVAILGCVVPARRACRTDPAFSLREE